MVSESASYLGKIENPHGQIPGLIAESPTLAMNRRPVEGKGDQAGLHLGHMKNPGQLSSGGKSILAPLWYERLPQNQDS